MKAICFNVGYLILFIHEWSRIECKYLLPFPRWVFSINNKIKSLAAVRPSSVKKYFLGLTLCFSWSIAAHQFTPCPLIRGNVPLASPTRLLILLLPEGLLAGGCQQLYVSSPDLFHRPHLLEDLKR